MSYKVGNWTKSTSQTLTFIKERSDTGKNPKLHNFPSGTYRNWVYPLVNGGYVINEDGYKLTDKGLELLKQLIENPPSDRRGKKRIIEQVEVEEETPKRKKKQNAKPPMYRITLGGRDLAFDTVVTHEEAMKIIKEISQIKGNN